MKSKKVGWFFLLPSLCGVVFFQLAPFIDVVRRSFLEAMNQNFVGFDNYKTVLNNKAFQLAAGNTIKFLAICIPSLLLFSLLLSFSLSKLKRHGEFIKTSFLVPMAIPVASVVLLWKALFHNNGLINKGLVAIGEMPIDWLNTEIAFYVLVVSYLWKNCGYNMVLWLAGLNGIPDSQYEAASIDGCGSFAKLWYITLPNLRGTFFTVSVLSLINSFKVFREAYLIAGDYPNETIYMIQHLFNHWFVSLDIQKMCAAAVMMTVVILIIILILKQFGGKEDSLI